MPSDVSVIGFDGAGVDAHFSPRLTTVEVPLEEIGALGVRTLLQEIVGESVAETNVLRTRLRIGQSSSARLGVLSNWRMCSEKQKVNLVA